MYVFSNVERYTSISIPAVVMYTKVLSIITGHCFFFLSSIRDVKELYDLILGHVKKFYLSYASCTIMLKLFNSCEEHHAFE
jgi:hypothetical protein